jgi:hypothetical protein
LLHSKYSHSVNLTTSDKAVHSINISNDPQGLCFPMFQVYFVECKVTFVNQSVRVALYQSWRQFYALCATDWLFTGFLYSSVQKSSLCVMKQLRPALSIFFCVCYKKYISDVWLTVHRNSVWIRKTN